MKKTTVVLCALVALVAGSTACKQTSNVVVDPALSTLVPADTTMLAGVRVEELLKTPVYQKYLAKEAIQPLDEFANEFGIDPRKDLWELLYISNGKESVVLGRGKFSNEAEPKIARERQGAKRTNYRGFTMVGDERSAVLMLGPSVMGVGDTAGLKRIVDARDKTNGPPAILAARIKEIPAGPALWAVTAGSPVPLPPNADANTANIVKVLRSVESGSFYLDLRTGISGKAVGIAGTDAAAKELHDALRGMLGIAQSMVGKNNIRLQRLLEGLRVTQDGRKVNLYIEEQDDTVTMLMELLQGGGLGRGGQGRGGQGQGDPTRLTPLR
jgi:hypothetical protein